MFCFILLFLSIPSCFASNLRFKQITKENGLSNTLVLTTMQDKQGFLWFGTENGLNRYDGYQFKVFLPAPDNPDKIGGRHIDKMILDTKERIWLVFKPEKLSVYDPVTEKFMTFQHNGNNPNSLSHNEVEDVLEDSYGNIWIATENGLNRYRSEINGFQRYFHDPDNPNSLSDNRISKLYEDSDGRLWVGTMYGLNCFDPIQESFDRYYFFKPGSRSYYDTLAINWVHSIYEDNQGVIWVGSAELGLFRLDKSIHPYQLKSVFYKEAQFFYHTVDVTHILESSSGHLYFGCNQCLAFMHAGDRKESRIQYLFNKPCEILNPNENRINDIFEDSRGHVWIAMDNDNYHLIEHDTEKDTFIVHKNDLVRFFQSDDFSISDLFEDNSGILWFGTIKSGLLHHNLYPKNFSYYGYEVNNPISLYSNDVYSVYEDDEGILWVGTKTGLNRLDRKKESVTFYGADRGGLQSSIVGEITEDQNGYLWLGFFETALSRFDPRTEHVHNIVFDPEMQNSVVGWSVRSIIESKDGTIWFTSYTSGLSKLNDDLITVTNYTPGPLQWLHANATYDSMNQENNINDYATQKLYVDDAGIIWVGTRTGGLNRFDPNTEKFTAFQNVPNDSTSLSGNDITLIEKMDENHLWVGTGGLGLNLFNKHSGYCERFLTEDGLSGNFIHGLLPGEADEWWISTDNGLSCFNYKDHTFRNYRKEDGLQGDEFNEGAYFKNAATGELFFGGTNGLTSFFPEDIRDNQVPPKLVFTDFKIANQSIEIGKKINGRILLEKSLNHVHEIKLLYDENDIMIEFAALHYALPEKNQFKYMLEGYDKKWKQTTTEKRFAIYNGLKSGKYHFKVVGANNDNVWAKEPITLGVTILPPFWGTWWFRISVLAFVMGVMVAGYKLRTYAMRSRNEELESINIKLQSEIQERKLAQKQVMASLEEKEVLLKEIHHRVKNNMQVISSLLSLQSKHISNKELLAMFKESQNRVRSMALIHEKLYRSKDFTHIDFGEYVKGLTREIYHSLHIGSNHIKIDFDVNDIFVSIDQAVPCGLIINELVTNSLKYAFPDDFKKERNIKIIMQVKNGLATLLISDNGIGMKEEIKPGKSESLGLNLVEILACDQLEGDLDIQREDGTQFTIRFNLHE